MSDGSATGAETLCSDDVRATAAAVEQAHILVGQGEVATRGEADDPEQWQALLEANAAAVLDALPHVELPHGFAVRYRVYERKSEELRVRPFVARTTADIAAVRTALEWHAPPDTASAAERLGANRDVDLLYRHFLFTPSALGVFQYWLAMQEIWASLNWVHTRVIADERDFTEIVGAADWQVERQPETHQPVVLRDGDGSHLALLLYSPLRRHSISLQQVEIRLDQSIVFGESITVATGPRGYVG